MFCVYDPQFGIQVNTLIPETDLWLFKEAAFTTFKAQMLHTRMRELRPPSVRNRLDPKRDSNCKFKVVKVPSIPED